MSGYVSKDIAHSIAQEALTCFEVGNLYSGSSLPDIARVVRDILADEGLSTRWSLCLMIARQARGMWFIRIQSTKKPRSIAVDRITNDNRRANGKAQG